MPKSHSVMDGCLILSDSSCNRSKLTTPWIRSSINVMLMIISSRRSSATQHCDHAWFSGCYGSLHGHREGRGLTRYEIQQNPFLLLRHLDAMALSLCHCNVKSLWIQLPNAISFHVTVPSALTVSSKGHHGLNVTRRFQFSLWSPLF